MHTLIPQCDESELTLSKLRGKMYDQLLNLVECDASSTRSEANQLWQFLMLAHCPLLIPHDQATDALRIDSFDWHDLHAGTLFLSYASPEHLIPKDKSFAQAIGNILFILSRATGQYGHFFKLPAALHAALTSSPTQGEMFKKRPYSLSHYFAARNAHLATHDRVAAFQEAIGQWRTRRQLAKDIIARHRPGLSPAEQAETLQRYLYPYAGLTARKPAHATDMPQSDLTDLPQLEEAYRQMTEKVSRSYVAQYRWLCAAGWEGLADDEQNYLRQATIHLIQLWFLQPSQRRPEWSQSEHVYRPKENIDVFKAVWGDEVRFYAAINASDGCKVRRIDKIDTHLDELMQATTVAEAGIHASSLIQVKSEQQSLATFIDTIAHRHEEMFTGRLSEFGKVTTFNEMLHTALVAKMPFTDCYEHRPDAEGLDCHLNTHLLMTVMGEMATSAKNDAQRRVIDAVITGIRSNLLLTKRGGDGLRIPLPDAANHGQPAAPQPPGAPTSGVDYRLDPDVEGIYSLSKAAVAHVVTMGYAVSETLHDNGWLLTKMDDHAFLRPLPDAPVADLIAVAGQYKLTLPFQRISQHGIYAKVMPEMGALYGPQFMLQQRNKNSIGVIEQTSDVLDVYFMFPPSSRGASVMRAAHITLDLAGIATGDLPALQRFISLRPAMGLKYINVRKISVLLDRFLGKGQYYMLSHDGLQQNQKATSTFPASFLHQNKERMLEKTAEAREAVLALKQLFAEAGFLPRDRDKSLAQSPPLPRTSPIYHYLLFALGVTPADDKIIQYAARWLCYYTERIDEEFAARPLAENVLFVAHKARRIQPDGKPSLMGFTFCNDKYRRLLIMADSFDDANQTLPRMHLLHEASLRLASVNYLRAPIATDNGQTNERVEIFADREDIREADLMYYNVEGQFIDRYRRALLKSVAAPGETDPAARQRRNRAVTAMSRAAFIKRLWQDKLLRANLLMDGNDSN
ncbi:hypothetical protein AAH678_23850 [Sodalis endosymbiont of Spalangia cameroni]|uniref:hypothetical protein n=1 Tax=Sodalis praecaptivus TaxID=1239307 RepID=UPI0031F93C2A